MILDKLGRTAAALIAVMIAAAATIFTIEQATARPALPASAVVIASSQVSAETPVELAHGCHRGVLRDNRGWHFHSGACVRRNTPPPGLYDYPSNRRYYRGPLCSYRCGITGGVKICRSICR